MSDRKNVALNNGRGRPIGSSRFGKGGIRDTRPKLKRLTTRHYNIIAMHFEGYTGRQIAQKIGCTPATVYNVLTDPLVEPILAGAHEGARRDIDALFYGKVIPKLDEGLDSEAPKVWMGSIDRVLKIREMENNAGKRQEQNQGQVVNVNVVQSFRERFVKDLQDVSYEEFLNEDGEKDDG